MVLEVVDPYPDRLPAGLFAGVGARVEDLVGQQPVEPLHFAVVARRVEADSLVPPFAPGPSAAAVGDPPDLLHVQVDHVWRARRCRDPSRYKVAPTRQPLFL